MRIVQIISRKSCDSGGSLQALLLAKSLKDIGEDVVFISRGEGCAERAREFGVKHFSVPMKGYLDWHSILRLGQFFLDKKTDVIHAHKGLALWFSIVSSFILGSKTKIFANRGVSFSIGYFGSFKYRCPLVKGIICVAYAVKNQLARDWISPEKLKVIYGSVDPKFFTDISMDSARQKLKIGPQYIVFTLIGNFRPWKGHILLAKAVSMLLSKRRDVFCLFAGKEKKAILQRIVDLLGKNFLSLGYRKDVEHVMGAADILVNASTEGEGLPGVIREAMAMGRAVIATDVAGNREIVRNRKTGILVGPSVVDILEALKLLTESPVLRKKMGINGKKIAFNFSYEKRARIMLRFYESC